MKIATIKNQNQSQNQATKTVDTQKERETESEDDNGDEGILILNSFKRLPPIRKKDYDKK